MAWKKTDADRKAENAFYNDPAYKRNKATAKRRANGKCEDCGHRHKTQCDHVIPRTQGGTHAIENLMMRCVGEGTCKCHEKKTAQEGGGYRSQANRGNRTPRDPRPRPRTNW